VIPGRRPGIPGRPKGEWKVRKHKKKRWRGELGPPAVKKMCRFVILRRFLVDLD
jgi:hypothetical protein